MITGKKKQAFDAPRLGGFFSYDPADLTLIVDEKDDLYDDKIHDPVPDEDLLNAAAQGIQQNITVRRRGNLTIVTAGRQRTKRALIVNALMGVPYTGPVQSVHAAIKRLSTVPESIAVAKRIVIMMGKDVLYVPARGNNEGDEADARIVGFTENAFRRQDDPVKLRATEAQRLERLGWDVTRIADKLGPVSIGTVKRWLQLDTSKPREKEKRPKLVRPSAVALTKVHEKIEQKLTERERVLLDWLLHGKGDAKAILVAFGVKG